MSFEEFGVVLLPTLQSPFSAGNDPASVEKLVRDIMTEWPIFQYDALEEARRFDPLPPGLVLLAAESAAGLIQLTAQLGYKEPDDIALWMRFAYCNPRSVDSLFSSIVERLMQKYRLYCHIEASLPSELGAEGALYNPDAVCDALLPSIEYNRNFWQSDAATTETAILRSGDAIARFITPQLISASERKETQIALEAA